MWSARRLDYGLPHILLLRPARQGQAVKVLTSGGGNGILPRMKNKRTRKEKFGWSCQWARIYGSFHADNERCSAHCRKEFDSKEDAARAALNAHPQHRKDLCVWSTKTGYIGLAEGINFHITKS